MTNTVRTARRIQPKRRLTTVIAAATLLGAGGACMVSPAAVSAGSTPATSDLTIAAQADRALVALAKWESTARATDFAAYTAARANTAAMTGAGVGVSGAQLDAAWSKVSIGKQHVLLAAISQLGVPYRSMASKEGVGFDCSGLMLYAFDHAGIELPRSSRQQYQAGTPVDEDEAEAGDVVFYPGHISLYLGLELIVHSPQSGMDVEVRQNFTRSLKYADVVDSAAV